MSTEYKTYSERIRVFEIEMLSLKTERKALGVKSQLIQHDTSLTGKEKVYKTAKISEQQLALRNKTKQLEERVLALRKERTEKNELTRLIIPDYSESSIPADTIINNLLTLTKFLVEKYKHLPEPIEKVVISNAEEWLAKF